MPQRTTPQRGMPPGVTIIVAGATGFIGSTVLSLAISNPRIAHVFALARKPIAAEAATHPKVTEIILNDFKSWPQTVLDQFKQLGAIGCIWCIGGPAASFSDVASAELANVDLAVAAATALSAEVASPDNTAYAKTHPHDLPFRFIYLSVTAAERNPSASVWVQAQIRKMKGAAEKALFDIAARHMENPDFEVCALRLGSVMQGGQTTGNVLWEAVSTCISVHRVAAFCLDLLRSGKGFDLGKEEAGGSVVENAAVLGDDWAQINTMPRF